MTAPCRRRFIRFVVHTLAGVVGMIGVFPALAETPITADQAQFFEKFVRPVLAEKCVTCHGEPKQKGGLRLDSAAALRAGGESGSAIEPGRPEDSLLISAINYEGLEMPPTGKLDAAAIAALTEWVRMGAPWPDAGPDGPTLRPKNQTITDQDRAHWAYQPVKPVEPPALTSDWIRTPIDAFILSSLQANGLKPASRADRVALVRRAYLDLWGLPPTPAQVDAFLADESPEAFARLVDALLDDPNYGRRWARHWLDLVRYAESDGYKQDGYRPEAYRYRDYVVDAFNSDKPYDQFVIEQLAGDEVAPHDLKAVAATAYLRHTIYEYNQRDARTQWDLMLNELTDVTADVFLGVGLGCARCHDHKFDPIPQRDYFRFRAFFEPLLPRDDIPFATAEEIAEYQRKVDEYLAATQGLRDEIAAIEKPFRERVVNAAIDKFPKDIRPMMRKAPHERLPQEQQLAELAYRQVTLELDNLKLDTKLKADEKARYESLREELAKLDHLKPKPLPMALTVTDVGPEAPPTLIPGDAEGTVIEPGFLSVLDAGPAAIPDADLNSRTTGRRTALARWITDPSNPLTARVMANRVWQYHFGKGLAASSSDFGRLGELPSHPELLDWLAARFVSDGWSLKSLHRLIMNSAVYQQGAQGADVALAMTVDPSNRWYWHMPPRRLDAEQIRDAMYAVSGELKSRGAGPADDINHPVRTIYTKVVRNDRHPLLDAFDAPDAFGSTAQRNTTTTPTQSLLMINSETTLARARALAGSVAAANEDEGIQQVFRRVLARYATDEEMSATRQFLSEQAARIANQASEALTVAASQVDANAADGADAARQATTEKPVDPRHEAFVDFCHVLLNSSEFLFTP